MSPVITPDPRVLALLARYEWRYTARGAAVHALHGSDDAGAACGLGVLPASEWRGTGSQAEYERAAALPPCLSCLAAIGALSRA